MGVCSWSHAASGIDLMHVLVAFLLFFSFSWSVPSVYFVLEMSECNAHFRATVAR